MKKKQAEHRMIITNIPNALDIGFTAVTLSSNLSFMMENPNDYPVQFHFEFLKFKITPDR